MGNPGAYKYEMIGFCLNVSSPQKIRQVPAVTYMISKTVVGMKRHMEFGKSKGIEGGDLSPERLFFRHKDKPPVIWGPAV